MASIWSSDYQNGKSSILLERLREGLEYAKKEDYQNAFHSFEQALTAVNLETPETDSEIKFNLLRLMNLSRIKDVFYSSLFGIFITIF